MSFLKSYSLDIIIGDSILGINESFSALKSVFYFRIGKKNIPENNFIGCPNATLVWLLKAARLIVNGKYDEREIFIYGSDIRIVLTMINSKKIQFNFVQANKIICEHSDDYLKVLTLVLSVAEKSVKLSKAYSISTMAESVIETEIRLMKKHIDMYNFQET